MALVLKREARRIRNLKRGYDLRGVNKVMMARVRGDRRVVQLDEPVKAGETRWWKPKGHR